MRKNSNSVKNLIYSSKKEHPGFGPGDITAVHTAPFRCYPERKHFLKGLIITRPVSGSFCNSLNQGKGIFRKSNPETVFLLCASYPLSYYYQEIKLKKEVAIMLNSGRIREPPITPHPSLYI